MLSEGLYLWMYRDSRVSRLDFDVAVMILKLFCCIGWPVEDECSRIEENGGACSGRLLLTEIALCSPNLHRNWRLVDAKY